ncbi:hypothetical protein BC936DRAFT_144384 [Jimgerdemannia flammicorona]|uniref:Uncharacterized protein n=1 Tax=Jimgerdemannia flammicorona TaxID=994334 RepID=A0A433DCJ9_9FUNG|nr:hypothetical protein BC936DRAFT_144384 [Jimgerdemannia flammicorona]
MGHRVDAVLHSRDDNPVEPLVIESSVQKSLKDQLDVVIGILPLCLKDEYQRDIEVIGTEFTLIVYGCDLPFDGIYRFYEIDAFSVPRTFETYTRLFRLPAQSERKALQRSLTPPPRLRSFTRPTFKTP